MESSPPSLFAFIFVSSVATTAAHGRGSFLRCADGAGRSCLGDTAEKKCERIVSKYIV